MWFVQARNVALYVLSSCCTPSCSISSSTSLEFVLICDVPPCRHILACFSAHAWKAQCVEKCLSRTVIVMGQASELKAAEYLLHLWGQLPKSIGQDDIASSDVTVVCLDLREIGCRWGSGACFQQTISTAWPTPSMSGMKQCLMGQALLERAVDKNCKSSQVDSSQSPLFMLRHAALVRHEWLTMSWCEKTSIC